jgi:predicted nucleic acid-binding protein
VRIFIDTSALLAVLDADDAYHSKAGAKWKLLIEDDSVLICSNYILLETIALLQHRFGIDAVRTFQEDVVPILTVEWIDVDLHETAILSVLAAGRKKLSLVDCTSFALMRKLGLRSAFTFDKHFQEQGFEALA